MEDYKQLTADIRKQRTILEASIARLDDVYIPSSIRNDKMQLRLDGAPIAGLQLLVSDLTDALIANTPSEDLG